MLERHDGTSWLRDDDVGFYMHFLYNYYNTTNNTIPTIINNN